MAERPVFMPQFEGDLLVRTCMVSFVWSPGLAVVQKQKSIRSLHEGVGKQLNINAVLEISSKSEDHLGVELSAFSLKYSPAGKQDDYFLESIFQASKVFEKGGPYIDIRRMPPLQAKRDTRLTESGRLVGFRSAGVDWPLIPKTAFYDWLYLNIIHMTQEYGERLKKYEGFTDIEFNPKKSVNCQAHSAALYVALNSRGLLNEALASPDEFINVLQQFSTGETQKSSGNRDLF